jgi:hypothetical protein
VQTWNGFSNIVANAGAGSLDTTFAIAASFAQNPVGASLAFGGGTVGFDAGMSQQGITSAWLSRGATGDYAFATYDFIGISPEKVSNSQLQALSVPIVLQTVPQAVVYQDDFTTDAKLSDWSVSYFDVVEYAAPANSVEAASIRQITGGKLEVRLITGSGLNYIAARLMLTNKFIVGATYEFSIDWTLSNNAYAYLYLGSLDGTHSPVNDGDINFASSITRQFVAQSPSYELALFNDRSASDFRTCYYDNLSIIRVS